MSGLGGEPSPGAMPYTRMGPKPSQLPEHYWSLSVFGHALIGPTIWVGRANSTSSECFASKKQAPMLLNATPHPFRMAGVGFGCLFFFLYVGTVSNEGPKKAKSWWRQNRYWLKNNCSEIGKNG